MGQPHACKFLIAIPKARQSKSRTIGCANSDYIYQTKAAPGEDESSANIFFSLWYFHSWPPTVDDLCTESCEHEIFWIRFTGHVRNPRVQLFIQTLAVTGGGDGTSSRLTCRGLLSGRRKIFLFWFAKIASRAYKFYHGFPGIGLSLGTRGSIIVSQ